MAYNKKGIYKINTLNSVNVTLLEWGFTSKWKSLCEVGTCEVYMMLIGDLIVGGDFQITVADKMMKITYMLTQEGSSSRDEHIGSLR